jgi:hypothetical protein
MKNIVKIEILLWIVKATLDRWCRKLQNAMATHMKETLPYDNS